MFGKLHLAGRDSATREAPGGADLRALRRGKPMVAFALAHPPSWTNSLSSSDPSGRAANTAPAVGLPSPRATYGPQGDPHMGDPRLGTPLGKGVAGWDPSAARR